MKVMRGWRRLALVVIVSAAALVSSAAPAGAHATLVGSDPPPNATFDEAPDEVKVWFSESVDVGFSEVELLDPAGSPVAGVEIHAVTGATDALVVTLPDLADGAYRLRWRTLSVVDNHVVEGEQVFGVGTTVLPEVADNGGEREPGSHRPRWHCAGWRLPRWPACSARWPSP